MPKVFITGINGFVGHHLVDCLISDYSITGLTVDEPTTADKNIKYFFGDITDRKIVRDSIAKIKPEYIIHLAAIATSWTQDITALFDVNLFGTINVYESVLEIQSQSQYNPKIIYVSSAEVYGQANNPESIDELSLLNPVNHYAASKVSADRISYDYVQNKKLNIIIVRPFTHTGPGQNKGFFIPDMASQIAELEKYPEKSELLAGNLEAVRDYSDVRDVVRAYKLIMESDIPPGEVLNICSGSGIRIREVLNMLLKMSNKKIVVKTDPSRLRPSDTPVIIGNNNKIKKLVNWKPEISFSMTLSDTLEFWRKKTI